MNLLKKKEKITTTTNSTNKKNEIWYAVYVYMYVEAHVDFFFCRSFVGMLFSAGEQRLAFGSVWRCGNNEI